MIIEMDIVLTLIKILVLVWETNGLMVPKNSVRTKQIATIGPSIRDYSMLKKINEAGVNIFRINMSHSTKEELCDIVNDLSELKKETKNPFEILVDLQGPKYRIGKLKGGKCYLKQGARVRIVYGKETDVENEISLPHKELFTNMKHSDHILLNDGSMSVEVVNGNGDNELECVVLRGGELTNKKGINIPDVLIPGFKLTEKDVTDVSALNMLKVDWVALSFVEEREDIERLRIMVRDDLKIMAKIERPNAVSTVRDIIQVSDGVLVARGDLGVEIGLEKVPMIQKRIIKMCNEYERDVVVATQMMESMITNNMPTRAEVSDVANAVLDGATGVMLSAETSIGAHPVECVSMQRKIILEAENSLAYNI
jgi:pyruvate kinase